MNSQKLLIISVIAALLILGGAVAFVKFRNAVPTASPNTPQADHVTIEDALTTCTGDEQCIVVDTTCSFCCKYTAINSKNEALFNQLFDTTCKKYSGTYCECHDLSSYPSCLNGKCQMVKWSENKPLKVPPVPAQTAASSAPAPAAPAPVPTPAPTPAPVTAPVPETPVIVAPVPKQQAVPVDEPAMNSAPSAFGEDETVPPTENTPQEAAPVPGDLYAPLPETYPIPAEEDDAADVIQP